MSEQRRSLMDWFGKRRESVVMRGTREHMRAIGDSVAELNKAIMAMNNGEKDKAAEALNRMILSEKEADVIEQSISEELSKGDLEAKEREDLLRLVRRTDNIADWAKESGMNLQLILEVGIKVPNNMWSHYLSMTKELEKATKELRFAIDSLGVSEEKANMHVKEVNRLEHVVDELYFKTKKEILFTDIDPKAVFILRDMLHGIENSADSCEDVADIIHILITAEAHKVK